MHVAEDILDCEQSQLDYQEEVGKECKGRR